MAESLASMTPSTPLPFRLQGLLEAFLVGIGARQAASTFAGGGPDASPILRLIAGDASDRKFFRLENMPQSAICMQFPKWEGGYGGDPLSWLGMQEALLAAGLPVPKVLHVDEPNCCIWTEDFGDDFLNVELRGATLDMRDPACGPTIGHYERALSLLVDVQFPRTPLRAHPAEDRFFDFEKLHFEMRFFLKHFLGGFLGIEMAGAPQREKDLRRAFEEDLAELCHWLDTRPRVLCHRDYHVRNVMIVEGTPRWIDFQDARMGPCTYDVVSLVRDSYVRITEETRAHLYAHYHALISTRCVETGLAPMEATEYETEILHMGLQRNIKALGSFGYLATDKRKPSYLRYVTHTIDTILSPGSRASRASNVADEYPAIYAFFEALRHGELRKLLERRLEEFQVEAF